MFIHYDRKPEADAHDRFAHPPTLHGPLTCVRSGAHAGAGELCAHVRARWYAADSRRSLIGFQIDYMGPSRHRSIFIGKSTSMTLHV